MNTLKIYILASILIYANQVFSQTIVVGGSPLNLPCGGGNVNLTALGNAALPVFGDNFNTGTVSPGWLASPAAQFNNPCGASFDGTTYLWMGPGTAAPRTMQTPGVDVSCGGSVCFDFKFVCESCGDVSPCEGADLYNEGVSLQWSTNGGATWTDMAYFAPNGNLLAAYPGAITTPVASGANAFTTWQNYCFTIPAIAYSANTMFRLRQWGSSGALYDHWGIDNFYVYATPCIPYYYDWAHIAGFPNSANVTTNVTTTTTFTCCYTNGTLSACGSVTVNVATIPPAVVTVTANVTCTGVLDGEVIIDNPGGDGPYDIILTGPVNDTYTEGNGPPDDCNIDGLLAGDYTYTTISQDGCVLSGTFTIAAATNCCTISATSVPATCFGQANGTATAIPGPGGVPGYTYEWFNSAMVPIGQTTQTASGLVAGTYFVTMTDNIGCVITTSIVVGQPAAAVSATTTQVNVTCFGLCNGSITINPPTGGTPGYTYNINGGTFQVGAVFPGLCVGNYTMQVKDSKGCIFTLPVVAITQPADVTLVQTAIGPSTCGTSNGTVTVTGGGGTGVLTYSIPGSPSNTTGVFTGLSAGAKVVTVTDANGCTETLNITILSAPGPAPFIDIQNNVTCAGALTGSVTIGVVGGSSPFLFKLDAGANQASNTFNSIPAGAHSVTVTDAFGCTGIVNFIITQPTALTFTSVAVPASCNGVCDGQITITASNANPPYTYSSNNGLSFQVSNILTGLCPGNINVVVKDANGCLANAVVNIAQPTVLTSTQGFVNPQCYQTPTGQISFVPAGGTPSYTFSVDNGTTFAPANPVTGLMAGVYNVVVKDNHGCLTSSQITLTDPAPFDFFFIANNPSNCGANDGSFEIIADLGVAPYFYSIDGGTTIQVNNGFFGGLFAGLYNLVVEDANGCIDSIYSALSDNVMTTQVDFTQDATCFNGSDGLGIVSQQFGAAPFTYTLTPMGTVNGSGVFPGLPANTYYVTIEDAGLCIGIQQFIINHPDSITFTPTSTDVTCNAGADGQINAGATIGGDGGPYQYSLNGGPFQVSPIFTGLTAGTYNIVAQDGNGCLGGAQIDVEEPVPFTLIVNASDLTCNGNSTGFIQMVGGGSNPGAYTYTLGASTNSSGIFVSLAAGNYAIVVTDVLGCTFDTTQLITEPVSLSATYSAVDALCNGSCDGEITVTVLGGTPIYFYSGDGGITFQSSNVITGFCAGPHLNIFVKDDNDCILTGVVVVNEPTLLTMGIIAGPASCGQSNGDITINANNGTPVYEYSIDGGISFQFGNSFVGLPSGNYDIVLQDQNNCQITDFADIPNQVVPVIDNVISVDPLCFGDANGSITIISSSGVGAHEYSITGGAPFQASNVFNGLSAGVYNLVVRDANLCTANAIANLTDPPLLTYNAVLTDLTCNGNSTGGIVLTANGGTPLYEYSIDNGINFQGAGTFSFIAAGIYDIVIQDNNNCQVTGQETISEPAPLVFAAFNVQNPLCNGICNGVVTTNVTGGTGAYTYLWSGGIAGLTEASADSICDGTYNLLLFDDNGCTLDSASFILTQPVPVPLTSVLGTDLLCFNDATGVITIDAPTAVQYSIDGGLTFQPGNVFNGLSIGNYDIVVEDADACQTLSNITISEPSQVFSVAPSDWFGCFGATVNIQAFTTGGTVPYSSYTWTNNFDATVVNTDIFNYVITQPAPGVDFTLVVVDANGCIAAPVTYNVQSSSPLTGAAGNDTTICIGSNATLYANAGGGELIDFGSYLGYGYSWNTGVAGDTLQFASVSPIVQTTYTVTITDGCGQTVQDDMIVNLFVDPITDIVGGGNGCLPELISFTNPSYLSGGTCLWDFGDGNTSTSCSTASNLYNQVGCFDVSLTVTSIDGCAVTSAFTELVCISGLPTPGFYWNPDSPSILDPVISIVNTSENAVFYEYNFGGLGTSFEEEPEFVFPETENEATYVVCQHVTSQDGCLAHLCQNVFVHEEIIFYVPNVFTPDGDLHNQTFKPEMTSGIDMYNYHLTIFNRWGEIVFESYNYEYGWDGTYADYGLVEDGVYVWQIEFGEKLTDKRQNHRGHVTVLK